MFAHRWHYSDTDVIIILITLQYNKSTRCRRRRLSHLLHFKVEGVSFIQHSGVIVGHRTHMGGQMFVQINNCVIAFRKY